MLALSDKIAAMKTRTLLLVFSFALTVTTLVSTTPAQVAGQPYRVSDLEEIEPRRAGACL